jgi:hypothetical protein
MERVISIDQYTPRRREAAVRSERLRQRRAAYERCERAGLLRQCRPVEPGREGRLDADDG